MLQSQKMNIPHRGNKPFLLPNTLLLFVTLNRLGLARTNSVVVCEVQPRRSGSIGVRLLGLIHPFSQERLASFNNSTSVPPAYSMIGPVEELKGFARVGAPAPAVLMMLGTVVFVIGVVMLLVLVPVEPVPSSLSPLLLVPPIFESPVPLVWFPSPELAKRIGRLG